MYSLSPQLVINDCSNAVLLFGSLFIVICIEFYNCDIPLCACIIVCSCKAVVVVVVVLGFYVPPTAKVTWRRASVLSLTRKAGE